MRLGEFDPRDKVAYAGIPSSVINAPAHNDLALEVALKTPVLLKNDIVPKIGKKALPLDAASIKKIAIIGPQADKVELGDYSGEVEPRLKISPLAGIRAYIAQHKTSTEIVSKAGGNTAKRTDFFTMIGFSTVANGIVKEYDATKFDASANGLIASARFGAPAVRGIKDGDWTSYNNVDITNVDSMLFNMTVSPEGGGARSEGRFQNRQCPCLTKDRRRPADRRLRWIWRKAEGRPDKNKHTGHHRGANDRACVS
jgi:hypothetical protein